MKNLRSMLTLGATALLISQVGQAQATRTWISGVGDDANPCSRTAPCKTWAGAISKTADGGEIDALDPGGFGALTITKSITLDGGGGQVASVLVAGTNGIAISAGVADYITIRNLDIQGIVKTGSGGLNGIQFNSGAVLHIEHCAIMGFTQNGINIVPTNASQVFIEDTTVQDNTGNGLNIVGGGSAVHVNVTNSHFSNNSNGVYSSDYSKTSVRASDATGNAQAGFIAIGNSSSATLSIANSTAANNGGGGVVAGGGAAASLIRATGVSLFSNGSGFSIGTNGTIFSFGNNENTGSGAPNSALPLQ